MWMKLHGQTAMKASVALLGAVMTMAAPSTPAFAMVWDFAFVDTAGDSASGQFVTGDVGYPYTITAVSGTFDGYDITDLSSYAAADQQLFETAPYADFGGISFTVANGNTYNWSNYLYALGSLASSATDPGGYGIAQTAFTEVSVRAVPEPSTWAMLLIGFAGLGIARYRKAKRVLALSAS